MSISLNPLHADYIEQLQAQYQQNPESLDPSWRYFFEGISLASRSKDSSSISTQDLKAHLEFEFKVLQLIQSYRELGYLMVDADPLNRGCQIPSLLRLERFGLREEDLAKSCEAGHLLGLGASTLKTILETLTGYYCSAVAVDYAHIEDPRTRLWLQKRIESGFLTEPLSSPQKIRCLEKLTEAEILETFLHKRFVGQKRFSAEGNDVMIPMLDFLIEEGSRKGIDEFLVGMAHRGRLNVLANIFEKDLQQMLGEFSGNFDANVGDGDVKYHMGFSQDKTTLEGKKIHLSLAPNPSHLEAVNAVLMGITRAKQNLKGDTERSQTLAILLHGDAAFSGQGVVYEALNLSDLPGYSVGGTIHIIVNNQVGFTTSPVEGRSTPHCTDVAKMLEVPILRVNADEPELALRAVLLAIDFRQEFKRDVVIDLVGYRRYGHNEGDEPSFTQPLMYQKIQAHPRVREIYAQRLIKENLIDAKSAENIARQYTEKLEVALEQSSKKKVSPAMSAFGSRWEKLHKPTEKEIFEKMQSGVPSERLRELGSKIVQIPSGFHPHPKIKKLLEERRGMAEGKRGIDWSFAELLSFASILCEGYRIRLTGQDSERGTFSSRHAVLHDVETGEKWNPFNSLQEGQQECRIINSPLSEYASLGFEFGQSTANPHQLTLWEAQFGDFVNNAQVIVDQFITSSAFKWRRYSGLVLLLPHGYEGQGPEHSSARLERFLGACAQNNIQVCNLTTPAQYFHLLRRQMLKSYRIPLVLMSPKSLLRHPRVISNYPEFEAGGFEEILDEAEGNLKQNAERIVLCSGKIYYDLLEARQNAQAKIPLIRVEQLYPFHQERMAEILASYPKASQIVWCQEAPQNMEAWVFILQQLSPLLRQGQSLQYVGRAAQASPADSYLSLHQKEQKRIIAQALALA